MIVVASPTPPRLLTEARQVSGNQGGLTVQLEDPDVPEGEATTVDLPNLLTGDPEAEARAIVGDEGLVPVRAPADGCVGAARFSTMSARPRTDSHG